MGDRKAFDAAMRLMRRRGQDAEDGFSVLQARAAEFLDELIEEFRVERKLGVRCWLLELIGYARDPKALPLLVEHLDDDEVGHWAVRGLQLLDTKEARTELYRYRQNNLRR